MDPARITSLGGYPPSQIRAVLALLGQQLTTITDRNRHDLLSGASHSRYDGDSLAQAKAILTELKRLNPEISEYFYLKQDVLSDLELRMICSAASPEETQQDVPSFIAVSYCWHYHDWPLAPSATPIVPGWEISKPMMEAVLGVRSCPEEGVWLDKLCIDQGSEADKTTHIASMDAIYRSARRVVILLEDVQLTAEEEEAGLAYRRFYANMSKAVTELAGEEKGRVMEAWFPEQEESLVSSGRGGVVAAAKGFAIKMLTARWFSRAWCAHESRMHPHRRVDNPLLLCFGFDGEVLRFEFRFIYYLALYLADKEPVPGHNTFITAVNDPHPTTIRQLYWRLIRLMPGADRGDSLLQHIVHVLSFGCLKKGDLLCIALNTAGIPLFYAGKDINSTEEVIWIASLLAVAAGDLMPLVMAGSKLKLLDSGEPFISWAIHPTQGMGDERVPNTLPNSINAITPKFIELDLLVFVDQPQKPSQQSLKTAIAMIKEHDLGAVAQELLAAADGSVQRVNGSVSRETATLGATMSVVRTNLDKFLETCLALAMDAGMHWMLNLPSAMASTTKDYQHGAIDGRAPPSLEARLDAAAKSLLHHLDLANPTEQQVKKMISCLATLLDPRLPLLTTGPRRLPLPSFLGGTAFTPSTSNRSYIAIPAAVAHLPAWHERAWIVEPFDPSASPEDPESHLPGREYTDALRRRAMDVELEDVVPVLNTDHDDRRAPMPTREQAAWRLRRRNVLFGCPELDARGIMTREEAWSGDGMAVLRKQRVYGCEDYQWPDIWKAMRMREQQAEIEGRVEDT
ncbi:hypothetical protein QBC41DRAFT_318965 [Cercophora samala]|uniref:Heterokaryon incompatibility domain-containing protein n=1 Tax=Cercophora samala TaxID=330535 RepID=A0AA39ZF29_9PEZI|nr:hypothetical protein QBC41DRAFT_318965 [Cercophora samala]